jgi:hypothetical protein
MANPKVYVETSVISYLTALPSRDLVLAAHQQVTREWWSGRDRFELLVSDAVLEEIARGDDVAAARRLAAIAATHGVDFLVTWNCTDCRMLRAREATSERSHVTLPPKLLPVERPTEAEDAAQGAAPDGRVKRSGRG